MIVVFTFVKQTTTSSCKMVHSFASTYSQGTWMSHAKERKGIWPKRHHTALSLLRSPVTFWQMISLHSFISLLQRWLLIWVKGSREGWIDWETLAWWKRKDSPWGPLAGVVCPVWISSLHQGPLTISPPLSNTILQTDGCLCFPADEIGKTVGRHSAVIIWVYVEFWMSDDGNDNHFFRVGK